MEIINEIRKVEDTDVLQRIIHVAQERRHYLQDKAGCSLRKGDRVVLNDSIRPKYLTGLKGEVRGFVPGKRRVRILLDELDRHYTGRYGSPQGTIDVPVTTASPAN